MSIATARRLAEATSCWLHYEYLCMRAGIFDESALKGAVGQVLSSFVIEKPSRAWIGANHPVLAFYSKRGRKQEIDFVLAELNGRDIGDIRIAVGTKWADSSHCSPANIVSVVFRLALLDKYLKNRGVKSECVFLLAGTKAKIKKIVASCPFVGTPRLPIRKGGASTRVTATQFKSGAWAQLLEKKRSAAFAQIASSGELPNATLRFYPGLPSINLRANEDNSGPDRSVKFFAMAWSVQGS